MDRAEQIKHHVNKLKEGLLKQYSDLNQAPGTRKGLWNRLEKNSLKKDHKQINAFYCQLFIVINTFKSIKILINEYISKINTFY